MTLCLTEEVIGYSLASWFGLLMIVYYFRFSIISFSINYIMKLMSNTEGKKEDSVIHREKRDNTSAFYINYQGQKIYLDTIKKENTWDIVFFEEPLDVVKGFGNCDGSFFSLIDLDDYEYEIKLTVPDHTGHYILPFTRTKQFEGKDTVYGGIMDIDTMLYFEFSEKIDYEMALNHYGKLLSEKNISLPDEDSNLT